MKNTFLLFFLFSSFTLISQKSKEVLLSNELDKRNITTKAEAIDELNRNGITLSQAQEMARIQGIDLNTFLSNNFGLDFSENQNKSNLGSDINDKIEVVIDTIPNKNFTSSNQVVDEIDKTYFGYEIFENNPFAEKDYLVGNIDEGYLLSPGDELRITVFGNNALNSQNKIDLNGNIIFPNLGVFQAAGNTLKTAKSRLKLFLGKFYNGLVSSPQKTFLDVSLTQIRPVTVNVIGEAKTPGPHLVNGLASVLNAIYSAGGIKTSGSLRKVLLYRNDKLQKEFDLYDYVTQGNIDSDVRLMNSDIIFIPPRLNSVKLEGGVNNESIYELKQGETINDIINFSGGFKPNASMENANLSRIIPFEDRVKGEKYDKYLSTINLNDNMDFELIDGDVLSISTILTKRLNEVTLKGNVNKSGTFSIDAFADLKSLILIAGKGLLPNTYMDKVDIIKENSLGEKSFKTYNLRNILDGTSTINLEQDDVVKIYSLTDVEGEKTINISGFGVDNKTVFWRKNLSMFDIIFESTSFNELEFQSKVLSSRVDLESFNNESGKFLRNVYSLDDVVGLKKTFLSPSDKIILYSKSVTSNINPTITIFGSVNEPKTISLNENMTVEDAILSGGGFEVFAIKDKVDVVRKLTFSKDALFSRTISINVDMDYLLGLTKSPVEPFYLEDNDVVVVRKNNRDDLVATIKINGEVNLPGVYSFPKYGLKLQDYVEYAGGFTDFANLESSKLLRDGKAVTFNSKSDFKSLIVFPGDEITIGSETSNVLVTGTGIYLETFSAWEKNKRSRYYIKKSGGLKERIESKLVIRNNGSSKKISNFFSNPIIYPGDVIVVEQKLPREKSEKTIGDEFVRIFSIVSGALTTILLVTKL